MFPILKYEFPKSPQITGKPSSMQTERASHGSSPAEAAILTAPATPSKQQQQQRFSQISTLRNSTPTTTRSERYSIAQANTPSSLSARTGNSTPTLRERRGRRSVVDRIFTPLSIFTKSSLAPFTFDTDRAIQILKSDIPDRVDIAKEEVSPQHAGRLHRTTKTPLTTGCSRSPTKQPALEGEQAIINSGSLPKSLNSEIDLVTALNVTSPELRPPSVITADFGTLTDLPAPDISQHPAYASKPFESISDAPIASTTSSVTEIRKCNPNHNKDRGNRNSLEKKRSFFGLDRLATPSLKGHYPVNSPGVRSQPESKARNTPLPPPRLSKPRSTTALPSSAKSTSPKALDSPRQMLAASQYPSGVRKFSDLLRSKKSVPGLLATQTPSPIQIREKERRELEKWLRVATACPSFDEVERSSYPRHPHTRRGWLSRNLKCTVCLDHDCAICHRVCCAYKSAVLGMENFHEGTTERERLEKIVAGITKLFPYGRELPTFFVCTSNGLKRGRELGCGKTICPDCCSQCPEEICKDVQCRRCKAKMWTECDWHAGY